MLQARGVDTVFGLCGGHIMPIWMALDEIAIRIVDVRDERAAAHMAQAYAEVSGRLGVALVTAGPGVTNAITGIANSHVARAPVLILSGCPPRPQTGRGALQDLDSSALVRPVTRYARTIGEPSSVPRELDRAISLAMGLGTVPGPSFIDFPTDTLRAGVPHAVAADHLEAAQWHAAAPSRAAARRAAELVGEAHRPLVISGRGARGAGAALRRFLDRTGALYLDTAESRGLIEDDHPSVVAAMRGRAMAEADLIITVGRKLDFQLAYGSGAVIGATRFIRLADNAEELSDNRRGAAELLADPAASLDAIAAGLRDLSPALDAGWIGEMKAAHRDRSRGFGEKLRSAPAARDGRMHPNRLLAALRQRLGPKSIAVLDGGDFLSFARVALSAGIMLDPGPFGCIGTGVPYGIGAAIARPDRDVIVATGDGAFGFNAIELDTAVRHGVPVVFVVANNGAWQIEAHDQRTRFGRDVGTRLRATDYAALASALGLHAERVGRPEDLEGALDRAFAKRPALVDVLVSPEAVSSDARSGLALVPDLQPLTAWDNAERAWREAEHPALIEPVSKEK